MFVIRKICRICQGESKKEITKEIFEQMLEDDDEADVSMENGDEIINRYFCCKGCEYADDE